MKRLYVIAALMIVLSPLIFMAGCEKEKIVESTEYVHDIEYVEMPADTVFQFDTVIVEGSSPDDGTDTVFVTDTVVQTDNVYDTVVVSDTVVQTEYVYDTVVTVDHQYDTVTVTDTVETVIQQCDPNEYFAAAALHNYCDPLVLEFINQEFQIDDGWIFYLSTFQLDLQSPASGVYDMYGYIDYWTPDWSGFYPLEFYWRMVYLGGDPANMANWEITLPPATASHSPGVRLSQDGAQSSRTLR